MIARCTAAGRSLVYDAKECNAVAPKASPEGAREAGIGQRRDAATALLECLNPAAGSHLPLESTAPPFAVAPFVASPFVYPNPAKPSSRPCGIYSAVP
jgi:hypothetical protein